MFKRASFREHAADRFDVFYVARGEDQANECCITDRVLPYTKCTGPNCDIRLEIDGRLLECNPRREASS